MKETPKPLSGTKVFVEVFNDNANISSAFHNKLRELGASVSERFHKTISHVVWKEGTRATYERAISRGLPIVTPLWIHRCETNKSMIDPKDFIPPMPTLDMLTKRKRPNYSPLPNPKRAKTEPHKTQKELTDFFRLKVEEVKTVLDFQEVKVTSDEAVPRYLVWSSDKECEGLIKKIGDGMFMRDWWQANIFITPITDDTANLYIHCTDAQLVSRDWLDRSCENSSWEEPKEYSISKSLEIKEIFKSYRFYIDKSSKIPAQALAPIIQKLGGECVSNPREGDYIVTELTNPKLPSYIKQVKSDWLISKAIE